MHLFLPDNKNELYFANPPPLLNSIASRQEEHPMRDHEKTKDQLIDELNEMRSRVSELESDKAEFMGTVTEHRILQQHLLQTQKLEAVGSLARGIAHDLNNLLYVVLGFSGILLQRKHEGDRDYADLQEISRAGKRGAVLVQSLLTLSTKVEP